MGLSKEDQEAIERLKEAGVLRRIEDHLLDQTHGAILVCCSDGDRFCEALEFQAKTQLGHREEPRIHPVAVAGGPLGIPSDSPVNRVIGWRDADQYLLAQIRIGVVKKEIPTIILLPHVPCAMCAAAKLNVYDEMALIAEAKQRVQEEFPDVDVACKVHVDYGDRKKTFFFSRPDWEDFRATL